MPDMVALSTLGVRLSRPSYPTVLSPSRPHAKMKFLSTTSLAAVLGSLAAQASPVFDELVTPTAPLRRASQALAQVSDFGANASKTKMYIYVPDKLADKPPIIVAIHYCSGTAQKYYNGSPYAKLADQKGFIVIYPESPYSGTCWDVSSRAALSHDGGGDSNSIANMVKYTLNKYKGDETKVFVTGSSSGAMMTVRHCTTHKCVDSHQDGRLTLLLLLPRT